MHTDRGARLLAETRAELEEVISDAQRLIEERRSAAEDEIAEQRRLAAEELACERAGLEQQLRSELTQEYEERFGAGIRAVEALGAELEAARARCLPQLEAEALGLSLTLSRALLLRELSLDPLALQELISAALAKLQPVAPALLELPPAACAAIEALLESSGTERRLGRWPLELAADASLEAGQFRLSSGGRGIDVDVPEKLEELLQHIAQEAGREQIDSLAAAESDETKLLPQSDMPNDSPESVTAGGEA